MIQKNKERFSFYTHRPDPNKRYNIFLKCPIQKDTFYTETQVKGSDIKVHNLAFSVDLCSLGLKVAFKEGVFSESEDKTVYDYILEIDEWEQTDIKPESKEQFKCSIEFGFPVCVFDKHTTYAIKTSDDEKAIFTVAGCDIIDVGNDVFAVKQYDEKVLFKTPVFTTKTYNGYPIVKVEIVGKSGNAVLRETVEETGKENDQYAQEGEKLYSSMIDELWKSIKCLVEQENKANKEGDV